jgi:3'-5' exoribonuclease
MDKVLFGLIFHDAGKMHEYDPASPTFDVSLIGYLTPHIVLGPAWVYEAARQLPPELAANRLEIAHLMHLLAAHHGQEEWGSPVRPASLEALIVHHLDNLDSKVMHALELATHKPGPVQGMSERSFAERTPYLKVPPITPSNAW